MTKTLKRGKSEVQKNIDLLSFGDSFPNSQEEESKLSEKKEWPAAEEEQNFNAILLIPM